MDPLIIAAAIAAIIEIAKQLDSYHSGRMSEEEIQAFHTRVRSFLHTVQDDADTLRD